MANTANLRQQLSRLVYRIRVEKQHVRWLQRYTVSVFNEPLGIVPTTPCIEVRDTKEHALLFDLVVPRRGQYKRCHRCDNRLCINPDHIFYGTQSDNLRDCLLKGRHVAKRTPESLAVELEQAQQKLNNLQQQLEVLKLAAIVHGLVDLGSKRLI